jgi:hypothetical protein
LSGTFLQPGFAGQVAFGNANNQHDRFESKAMRRLGNDTGVLFVVTAGSNSVTNTSYIAQIRYLLKE